jgi:hypothetical protein
MNTQHRVFVTPEHNCFNLACAYAEQFPEEKLAFQGGVFLAFDYKHNYWDTLYTNHYWCINPEGKILDPSVMFWKDYAAKLEFDLRVPKPHKVGVITDPYRAMKICEGIRSTDPRFDHDQLFGGAHVVYFPGVFFALDIVPGWIQEKMKTQQHFTLEDVWQHQTQN